MGIESVGLILVIFGTKRLRISTQSEEYIALFSEDMTKFNSLTLDAPDTFIFNTLLWQFWALIICFSIIILLKYFNGGKNLILNSLISFLIIIGLFAIGLFRSILINSFIDLIGGIITNNFKMKFIINGLLWMLIGIGLISNVVKNTTYNKATYEKP